MTPKHKVFISFHSEDIERKKQFEKLFSENSESIISRSVQEGDIPDGLKTETIRQNIRDKYLRESTVTIVLIGAKTWQRKHVDWEIGSSIRKTKSNKRSGLIGILLPEFPREENKNPRYTIPQRLVDNVDSGFAKIYNWTDKSYEVKDWVHEAYLRKDTFTVDNSLDSFGKNRTTEQWSL